MWQQSWIFLDTHLEHEKEKEKNKHYTYEFFQAMYTTYETVYTTKRDKTVCELFLLQKGNIILRGNA